ncbi:DnaJ-like protein subfamily B member 9 [Bienertia sinuspersici]
MVQIPIPIMLDFKGGQQPSKNYARYATRQKRADTKKALWSLLSKYGESGTPFQNATSSWDASIGDQSNSSPKKSRSKSEPHRPRKIHNHKMRRKYRKGYLSEDDDDHPETVFQATFGNRWYTWSFGSQTRSSWKSTPGFEWRESFYRTSDHQQGWDGSDEPDDEDEAFNVGSRSDRVVLGLPQNGPLKLKDVKNAFHLSALKWHPDKHQGPSQAAAEEKFKSCVNAYKSLCSALSGA